MIYLTLPPPQHGTYKWKFLSKEEWIAEQQALKGWLSDAKDKNLNTRYTNRYVTNRDVNGKEFYFTEEQSVAVALTKGHTLALLVFDGNSSTDLLLKDNVPADPAVYEEIRRFFSLIGNADYGSRFIIDRMIQADPSGYYYGPRLPDHATIQGHFELHPFNLFFRLAQNLTVKGTITFKKAQNSMGYTLALPSGLTVTGNLSLINSYCEDIPSDLTVEGILITSGQTFTPYSSAKVTNLRAYMDGGKIQGRIEVMNEAEITGIQCKEISGLTAYKTDISMLSGSVSMHTIKTNELKLSTLGGTVTFGPAIECTNLNISKVRRLEIENAPNVSGNLEITSCDVQGTGGLVVQGDLIISQVTNITEVLKNSLVMGNCRIPSKFQIPDSFCCLGKLTGVRE